MTTWTCPICEGRGCSADHPCVKPRRESMPSGRIRFVCRHKGPHYEPSCSACFPLRTLPLESPQNAPASPAAPHGTSDGSKIDSRACPGQGAGHPAPVGGPTFWQPAPPPPAPGPTSATTLERLVADNRALTEQVTHLQEASNARLALARIRKVLELPEGASDQELVDEVARIRRGLGELWARAVSR